MKYTEKQVLQAIENTGGIRDEICKRLDCGRRTLSRYIDKFPGLRSALEDEEEKVLDMAESALFALIQNGDSTAIFYYLNNKGRKRGYGASRGQQDPTQEQGEERKTGVLVTPGILEADAWEQQAKK